MTLLQDAARGAARPRGGTEASGSLLGCRQLRSSGRPGRLFEAARHHVSAVVGSGLGHHQAVRDSQHDGAGNESTELRHSVSRHVHAEHPRRGHIAFLRAGLSGAEHGRQHHGQAGQQGRRAGDHPVISAARDDLVCDRQHGCPRDAILSGPRCAASARDSRVRARRDRVQANRSLGTSHSPGFSPEARCIRHPRTIISSR